MRLDATNSSPLVLLVGKTAVDACREIAAALEQVEFVPAVDVPAALAWIERRRREPAVIVIAQAWPGEIPKSQIASLSRRLPLSRICALLAPWCEGEMRSGKPWPAALRVYGHQWPARASRELLAMLQSRPSAWGLPVTASDEQRLLVEISPPGRAAGSVAVVAVNPATAAALGDACRSAGYSVISLRESSGVVLPGLSAAVWDTTSRSATDPAAVAELRQALGAAPILAVLGFPRPDEIAGATAAGIAAVISKPFLLADLHWQLAAVTGAARESQSVPSPASSRSVRRISRFHSAS